MCASYWLRFDSLVGGSGETMRCSLNLPFAARLVAANSETMCSHDGDHWRKQPWASWSWSTCERPWFKKESRGNCAESWHMEGDKRACMHKSQGWDYAADSGESHGADAASQGASGGAASSCQVPATAWSIASSETDAASSGQQFWRRQTLRVDGRSRTHLRKILASKPERFRDPRTAKKRAGTRDQGCQTDGYFARATREQSLQTLSN